MVNALPTTSDSLPPFWIRRLNAHDYPRAVEYLRHDPYTNLFVFTRLRRFFERNHPSMLRNSPWFRVFTAEQRTQDGAGHILGLCIVSYRLALPVTAFPEIGQRFGRYASDLRSDLGQIVGTDLAASAFWSGYRGEEDARLNRQQRYYTLCDTSHLDTSHVVPLRPANEFESEAVALASAAMHLEETFHDPMAQSPDSFRALIRQRIREGRAFVWMDQRGCVVFKADVSCFTDDGVLISGVYTRPDQRRKGYARRAMTFLCATLLERFPSVMLYVNADNTPAIRLYESMGFQYHSPYKTIFIE